MKKTITKQDHIHSKEIEQIHLNWFYALFTTIKTDLDNNQTLKARKLADIGQYLAQDQMYYCEKTINELTDKEA